MDDFSLMEEEKCGFFISKKRKRLWKNEIEILEKLNDICEKYDVKYFLIGGAAIGIERHKGFIPWDDDLDIGMLRNDFEKFLRCAKNEFKDPLHLQYGIDDINDASLFCRIRHSKTTAMIRRQQHQKCNHFQLRHDNMNRTKNFPILRCV